MFVCMFPAKSVVFDGFFSELVACKTLVLH